MTSRKVLIVERGGERLKEREGACLTIYRKCLIFLLLIRALQDNMVHVAPRDPLEER